MPTAHTLLLPDATVYEYVAHVGETTVAKDLRDFSTRRKL